MAGLVGTFGAFAVPKQVAIPAPAPAPTDETSVAPATPSYVSGWSLPGTSFSNWSSYTADESGGTGVGTFDVAGKKWTVINGQATTQNADGTQTTGQIQRGPSGEVVLTNLKSIAPPSSSSGGFFGGLVDALRDPEFMGVLSFAATPFLPALNTAIGQALGVSTALQPIVGKAVLDTAVGVAQGKDLEQAVGDAAKGAAAGYVGGELTKGAVAEGVPKPLAQTAVSAALQQVLTGQIDPLSLASNAIMQTAKQAAAPTAEAPAETGFAAAPSTVGEPVAQFAAADTGTRTDAVSDVPRHSTTGLPIDPETGYPRLDISGTGEITDVQGEPQPTQVTAPGGYIEPQMEPVGGPIETPTTEPVGGTVEPVTTEPFQVPTTLPAQQQTLAGPVIEPTYAPQELEPVAVTAQRDYSGAGATGLDFEPQVPATQEPTYAPQQLEPVAVTGQRIVETAPQGYIEPQIAPVYPEGELEPVTVTAERDYSGAGATGLDFEPQVPVDEELIQPGAGGTGLMFEAEVPPTEETVPSFTVPQFPSVSGRQPRTATQATSPTLTQLQTPSYMSPGTQALAQALRVDLGAPIFGGEKKKRKPVWNVESLRYMGGSK